jgi:hypothetical protein
MTKRSYLIIQSKGGILTYGYQLQIPACVDYESSQFAYHNETPSQFFFQHLIRELLDCIHARIHKYAYNTPTSSVINADHHTSKLFVNWMKMLSGNSILRLYTLNYENIFKILLEGADMPIFDGFEGPGLGANICKILSATESHIHYNLHGSAFWEVRDLDENQLRNPEIVLSPDSCLPSVNGPASVQIEKGKTLLVTNIVTGYQKAQKGMITPFKQMQAAFERDCCFADEIYVVGYSFGDEHINESIKTARRHNKKIEITIVDPKVIENRMDYKFDPQLGPVNERGQSFEEFLESP